MKFHHLIITLSSVTANATDILCSVHQKKSFFVGVCPISAGVTPLAGHSNSPWKTALKGTLSRCLAPL